ncbi:MAG: acyl carrier protein [Desulfobulbaceae bacterium]
MRRNGDEIFQRLKTVFAEEFELEPERLVPEATLFDDLELDSLDAVDMVVALEKEFGVKVKDEESMRSIRTLGDLHRLMLAIDARLIDSDTETAA